MGPLNSLVFLKNIFIFTHQMIAPNCTNTQIYHFFFSFQDSSLFSSFQCFKHQFWFKYFSMVFTVKDNAVSMILKLGNENHIVLQWTH